MLSPSRYREIPKVNDEFYEFSPLYASPAKEEGN